MSRVPHLRLSNACKLETRVRRAPPTWASLANQSIATGSFPLGSTTATLTVSAGVHSATDSTLVSVLDRTPPVLSLPPDVTTPTCTGVSIGQATAVDGCGGPVIVVNDASATFKAGTRIVTWRAIDQFGNVALATQRVNRRARR